jgi:TfoX/Sxy family transcriptional regulator of competence genes
MAFSEELAARVRSKLAILNTPPVTEKKMFGGLAFLVNGKMCINVSGDRLMCRFDVKDTESVSGRAGYVPMEMHNRIYKGYCYVEPAGFKRNSDFDFWLQLCLDYNHKAKSSKKK